MSGIPRSEPFSDIILACNLQIGLDTLDILIGIWIDCVLDNIEPTAKVISDQHLINISNNSSITEVSDPMYAIKIDDGIGIA